MNTFIIYLKKFKSFVLRYRFCYFKTIIANFRLLPFRQAIHLPLVIYNKTELKLSRSRIRLNIPPRFGLIKWACNEDLFTSSKSPSLLLMIDGTLTINGPARISPGCVFRIIGGTVQLGKAYCLGGEGKILCCGNIRIGDFNRMAFGTIVCDSDYHYIRRKGGVKNCLGEVITGDCIWVGNNSSIMKGTKLPDYTVIGSKSYVNKDFTTTMYAPLIVGSPAKVVGDSYLRIFSPILEKKIRNWFSEHPDANIYSMPDDEKDKPEDLLNK